MSPPERDALRRELRATLAPTQVFGPEYGSPALYRQIDLDGAPQWWLTDGLLDMMFWLFHDDPEIPAGPGNTRIPGIRDLTDPDVVLLRILTHPPG